MKIQLFFVKADLDRSILQNRRRFTGSKGSERFFTDFGRFCGLVVYSLRQDRFCDRFPVQPVEPTDPVWF
jgi:hypothetical protein